MSAENGSFVWVVLPERRRYDEQENIYELVGFSEPFICFTFPEMAEEWIKERQVKAFKSLALHNVDLSLYCNFGEAIMRYFYFKNPGDKFSDLDLHEYNNFKNIFFDDLNINEQYHTITLYEDMSDEETLEISRILNIQFYKIAKIKIIC